MHIAPKSPTEITRAHRMFEVALLLKGLNGLVELVGGTLTLFIPLRTVNQLVLWLTASEIENDPNDWLANTLIDAAEKLSMGTKEYASFYLLAHGAVKVFLVYSLWREKIWAFPIGLSLIGALVCYSLYRFTHTHAVSLLFFAAIDLIIMWFIWREYLVQRQPAMRNSPARFRRRVCLCSCSRAREPPIRGARRCELRHRISAPSDPARNGSGPRARATDRPPTVRHGARECSGPCARRDGDGRYPTPNTQAPRRSPLAREAPLRSAAPAGRR
jgi:uncharacterized membrane protein